MIPVCWYSCLRVDSPTRKSWLNEWSDGMWLLRRDHKRHCGFCLGLSEITGSGGSEGHSDTMPLGHSSGPMGRPIAWKTKASTEKNKVNSHAIEILQPESRFQITAGQGCLTYILTVISRETKTEPNSQVMTKFSIYRTCVKNVCCPKQLSFGVIIGSDRLPIYSPT